MSTNYLSPYDTGKRAEPKPWPHSKVEVVATMAPIAQEMAEQEFGKVDFDDEEGRSLYTVWVERNERGFPVVHVQQLGVDEVAVVIHRD